MSSSSITPLRANATSSACVSTTMPSATGVLQAIASFGAFSILTWHIRQLPSIDSFGW
jgi:hypothetical protein